MTKVNTTSRIIKFYAQCKCNAVNVQYIRDTYPQIALVKISLFVATC